METTGQEIKEWKLQNSINIKYQSGVKWIAIDTEDGETIPLIDAIGKDTVVAGNVY